MTSMRFLHCLRQVKGGILRVVVQPNDSYLKCTTNIHQKISIIAMICTEIPEKVPKTLQGTA